MTTVTEAWGITLMMTVAESEKATPSLSRYIKVSIPVKFAAGM